MRLNILARRVRGLRQSCTSRVIFYLTFGSGGGDRRSLPTNQLSDISLDVPTPFFSTQSARSVGRGDDDRVATVAPVKA